MNPPNVRPGKSPDEIADAYRSEPWWYDVRGFFILTFAYNDTLTRQLRFFAPNFGSEHLEVACGTGTLLALVLRWRRWKKHPAVRITGVDYAEAMLAGARHRFAGNRQLTFLHADAAALPFPAAQFDTANIANAVHCLPDVDGAFQEIFRVLKPGSRLAANVLIHPRGAWPWRGIAERINRWGIAKGILYTAYDQDDVRGRLERSGFEIFSEQLRGNCYYVVARKPPFAASERPNT